MDKEILNLLKISFLISLIRINIFASIRNLIKGNGFKLKDCFFWEYELSCNHL